MPGYKTSLPAVRLTETRKRRLFCCECGLLLRDAMGDETGRRYCRSCITSDKDVVKDKEADTEVMEVMEYSRAMEEIKKENQDLKKENQDLKRENELLENSQKGQIAKIDSISEVPLLQRFASLSEENEDETFYSLRLQVTPIMEKSPHKSIRMEELLKRVSGLTKTAMETSEGISQLDAERECRARKMDACIKGDTVRDATSASSCSISPQKGFTDEDSQNGSSPQELLQKASDVLVDSSGSNHILISNR